MHQLGATAGPVDAAQEHGKKLYGPRASKGRPMSESHSFVRVRKIDCLYIVSLLGEVTVSGARLSHISKQRTHRAAA